MGTFLNDKLIFWPSITQDWYKFHLSKIYEFLKILETAYVCEAKWL